MNPLFATASQQSNADQQTLTSASTKEVDEILQPAFGSSVGDEGFSFPPEDSGFDLSEVPARSEEPNGHTTSCEGGHCDCPNCSKAREEGHGAGVAEQEAVSVGEAAPAGVKEAMPAGVKEEGPVSVSEAAPVSMKQEGPGNLKGETPVGVKGETPVGVKGETPVNGKVEGSASVKEAAPEGVKEDVREGVKEAMPVSVKEEGPVSVGEAAPVGVKVEGPASVKEAIPVNGKEQTPVSAKGKGPVEAKEESPVSNKVGSAVSASGKIMEDTVSNLHEGQMTKTQFLRQMKEEIRSAIEPVLAEVGQTTDNCPYFNYWMSFYQGRDAREIERTVRKYAPASVHARTAEDYISMVVQRAVRSARIWAATGRIAGVPEGVPLTIPGHKAVMKKDEKKGAKKGVLQAKAKDGGPRQVDDPAEMQTALGEGQPLAGDVRTRMESAFGMSFSHVRTHTDSNASTLSSDVNARAFTVGNHVAFGSGEYQPGTMLGDALIAHELAHTIQQGQSSQIEEAGMGGGGYEALEQDADTAAAGAMVSLWKGGNPLKNFKQTVMPRMTSGLRLQRCNDSGPSATSNPAGPGSGSSTPATPAAPAAPAVTISAATVVPPATIVNPLHLSTAEQTGSPTKSPWGRYTEFIGWTTSGRNGVIVQEITNTYNITACPPSTGTGTFRPTPHYWEAWHVDASGNITPIVAPVHDMWVRPRVPHTSGNWSMAANVFWAPSLDPAANFATGVVRDAGTLLEATTTAPTNLGTSLLSRNASGSWDCTGAHT